MGGIEFLRSGVIIVGFMGFIAATTAEAQETRTTGQKLLGPVQQADDCTPELQRFNEQIMVFGRTAATTRAFEQCVDQEVRARYRKCVGDPHYGSPIATQISQVISASRSPGPVQITCTGGSGNASTGLGWFRNPGEGFNWGGWFKSVASQLGRPLCGPGQAPPIDDCRVAAMPWPYSQAAGIVWHEVMHTQGYTHGANDQAGAKVACGYANDAAWNFQSNTMPYILGDCIDRVIARSGERCGDIQACPGGHQLRLLTSYAGNTCACVRDPGKKGLAILGLQGGRLVDRAMLPEEDWIGGWHYGPGNAIRGTGDFDGDGLADFVITSGWGLGLLTHVGAQWRALVVKPNGTRFGSWNLNTAADRVVGVGDFDGDGKDELVLVSGWGLGILKRSGTSLTHLMMAPTGANFGGWNFNAASDRIRGIGDFNGDGKADLVVTSSWGIAILTVSGSTLTPVMVAPGGTRFGGWNFNALSDDLRGFGDFDGDGDDEILITSGWGLGLLRLQGSNFTHMRMYASGGTIGGYAYNVATARHGGLGDFDGDGKTDLVLATPAGLMLLGWHAGTGQLRPIAMRGNGQSIGGWRLNTVSDQLTPAGDLDGDGVDELVIRSGWGVGVLRRTASGLGLVDAQPMEGLFGSWQVAGSDKLVGVGPFVRGDGTSSGTPDSLLMQR